MSDVGTDTESFCGRKGSYEEQKNVAMTLMWYEVFFWKHKRVSLCRDVLRLSDKLDELAQQDKSL